VAVEGDFAPVEEEIRRVSQERKTLTEERNTHLGEHVSETVPWYLRIVRGFLSGLRRIVTSGPPPVRPGERPLLAFVSSVVDEKLEWARMETVRTLDRVPFLAPWAFEFTPASSEPLDESYLRKVGEADIVIWLVERETTKPVQDEIREALANDRPLWVMKLPADRRDAETEALMTEVGPRAKWMDTGAVGGLRQALELTLDDEIVRALRCRPGLGRLARLEEIGRASRGRCAMRWQAAGVPRIEAFELADDPSVGAPGTDLRPHADKPLLLLIGEVGVGKSLLAERLLQDAIAKARDNANAPVPIYLEARKIVGRLREAALEEASSLGNPRIQGAMVILDGVDEAGMGSAAELLGEARVLVTEWARTAVVLTSRPLPMLIGGEEAVQVPRLSETEANALVGRLAGRAITPGEASMWPPSVHEAVRRPLFAVLLGTYLTEQGTGAPRSTGELLSSLVERCLVRAKADALSANRLLQRLAMLSTDRGGGPVPEADVGLRNGLTPLMDSGLVIARGRALDFALPILTEWFAAQSLGANQIVVDDLVRDPQRLERWRFPLIIAAATFGHDLVSAIVRPLAETHPGFASQIVEEAVARWGPGEEVTLPPSMESGERVRTAMEAWTKGVGPLAMLIAPVRPDGSLRPLAVSTKGGWLAIDWYPSDADLPSVVDPGSYAGSLPQSGPFRYRAGQPAPQPAWAWRWALEDLAGSLSNLLRNRALPIEEGPLAQEAVWQTALTVVRRGSLEAHAIPLAELEERLQRLPLNTVFAGSRGGLRGRYALDLLRAEVDRLRRAGGTELVPPWPGPDRNSNAGGWVWDPYSPERLLDPTKAVYAGALEGYLQIVRTWLQSLAPRLHTAVMLPARLVGEVSPQRPGQGFETGPRIHWHLEPLARGSENTVDLHLSEGGDEVDPVTLLALVRSARPQASAWVFPAVHYSLLDVFGPSAATELAYSWLWHDLQEASWVQGILGG
jgi:hypothetical protein